MKFKPAADERPAAKASRASGHEARARPSEPDEPVAKAPAGREARSRARREAVPAAQGRCRPRSPRPARRASRPRTRRQAGPGFLSVAAGIPGRQGTGRPKKETGTGVQRGRPSAKSGAPAPARPKAPAPRADPGAGRSLTKERPQVAPTPDDLKDLKAIFDLEEGSTGRSRKKPYIPPVESSSLKTLFLGGGAYCFQRHMQFAYPGTSVDVAEIDPAVTRANMMATGLPQDTKIETYWGDARQFVELHQDTKKYDLIFGDAFNDFSVPWHLTTREFNEKLKKMLTPDGVYMINIIDVYLSDAEAKRQGREGDRGEGGHGRGREGSHPQEVRREGPAFRRLRRLMDQDGHAHLRQGQRLHLRHRRPGRGAARDVRGGGLDEAAGPQGSGPPQG